METTTLSIAGLTVEIHHLFAAFKAFAKDFAVRAAACDFSVTVTAKDIENERHHVETQREKDQKPCGKITDEMLEYTAIYRKIADRLADYNAVVFHGAAVAVGERAVVFSAVSGTGKTTHTRLWLKNIPGSYVVNGDKPILRIMDGAVFVCASPWNGKERFGTNKIVPLAALCQLSRAAENRIERVTAPVTFLPHLLEQTHFPEQKESLLKTLPVVEQIVKTTPCFRLFCNQEDDAARLSFQTLLP